MSVLCECCIISEYLNVAFYKVASPNLVNSIMWVETSYNLIKCNLYACCWRYTQQENGRLEGWRRAETKGVVCRFLTGVGFDHF